MHYSEPQKPKSVGEKVKELFEQAIGLHTEFQGGRHFSASGKEFENINKKLNKVFDSEINPSRVRADRNWNPNFSKPPYSKLAMGDFVTDVITIRKEIINKIGRDNIRAMAEFLQKECAKNPKDVLAAYRSDTGKTAASINDIDIIYFEEQVVSSLVFKAISQHNYAPLVAEVTQAANYIISQSVLKNNLTLDKSKRELDASTDTHRVIHGYAYGGDALFDQYKIKFKNAFESMWNKSSSQFPASVTSIYNEMVSKMAMLSSLSILDIHTREKIIYNNFLDKDPAKKQMYFDACFRLLHDPDPKNPPSDNIKKIASECLNHYKLSSSNEEARLALKMLDSAAESHINSRKKAPSHIHEIKALLAEAEGKEIAGEKVNYNQYLNKALQIVNTHTSPDNKLKKAFTSDETKDFNNNIFKNMGVDINATLISIGNESQSMKNFIEIDCKKMNPLEKLQRVFDRYEKIPSPDPNKPKKPFPLVFEFQSSKPEASAQQSHGHDLGTSSLFNPKNK